MRTTTLEEVLDEIIDHRGRTPKKLGADFTNAGVPVISAKLIRQGAIDFENVRFVSHETWEKWMPVPLQEGDVILTSEAPLGKTAFVPSNDPLVLGQRLFALRGKADVIDNAYLRYWLESEVGQAQLAGRASGTTVLGIRQALLRKVEIDLPPLRAQRSVGKFLKALDDKIVANQTSISKIDEILRALWQKELSLSNIDVPLSSLASFVNGKAFTKGASGTGRVVVRIAEMNSGIGSRTVYSDIDAAPDNVVDPGELLFAWSGTLMTKRWPYDQAIVNQHIFKVVPNGKLDLWALRQAIDAQLEYFQMIAAGKATTMGHIKRGDLDQEVEVPAQMSEEANQLGNSLWGLATSLEIQNLQLARTRDELLPLLMSGRITVGEAEDAAHVAGTAASES
ncbi:restriction endonuclease subunit S [Corynebacterium aurimucosum]|nr:restriction endonuclease subunit S [Corynebacterium aurimucosum]